MKIVGLCKTFSGNEFITAAIESVYPFLDKIVFVDSGISWTGGKGNTVSPVVKKWEKVNDIDNKIFHIDCNVKKQNIQYDIGYEYIKQRYKPDWIMIFDTDEVWDYTNLKLAEKVLSEVPEFNAVGANMHTYLKSPFYRVMPPEDCKPTVFIRPIFYNIQGTRGNYTKPRIIPDDLFFHHFTYVRKKESDVFKKIRTTLSGDKEDVPLCELVDIDKWKKEKWNKLPKGKNLHTTKGYEDSWYKVKKVKLNDLPFSVRGLNIVKKWRAK